MGLLASAVCIRSLALCLYMPHCSKWVARSIGQFVTSKLQAQRTERCGRDNRALKVRGVTGNSGVYTFSPISAITVILSKERLD